MNTFVNVTNEDQRFYILRALVELGYSANINMLITSLEAYGYRLGFEAMEVQLNWLAKYQLVELGAISTIITARLTQKGQDIAEGRDSHSGIRRPKAGEL